MVVCCKEAWASVMKLQDRSEILKGTFVIWVLGDQCAKTDTSRHANYAKSVLSFSNYRDEVNPDGMVVPSSQEEVTEWPVLQLFCDASSFRAYRESIMSGVRVMPQRTAYTDKVLAEVKRRISFHRHVILLGTSYGGLVASYVAEQLKDDPRAKRLHVRTFGTMYAPTGFWDIVHYLFTHDAQSTRYNWAKRPLDFQGNAQYDPESKVMWLRTYMAPGVERVRNPMDPIFTKIHLAYFWVMMYMLRERINVLFPFEVEYATDFEAAVSDAVDLAEKDYVDRKAADRVSDENGRTAKN